MTQRLAGKVAIITGASRGLGAFCAEAYAREGAAVAIAARTEVEKSERLPGTIHHTAEQIRQAGGRALAVPCNVADVDSVERMVERVLAELGRVDILMNNAAVQPPGFISTISFKHWELEFKVNVHGPLYCARAVLPHMLERGSGNIINISSIAARGGSHYGATKRALEAMTIGLAAELRTKHIAVNALKPVGAIETPGLLLERAPGRVGGPPTRRTPPPDSYVEAAILLAMQTAESHSGHVQNDAEVIAQLGGQEAQAAFRSLNPEPWVMAMDRAIERAAAATA